MNKVFTINLGGIPFTIDDDAYEHLSRYLDAIHGHFRGSEGYEEITQDIEARLAELFREQLGQRPIVNLKDVQAAIATMGTPEEFGAEPMDAGAEAGSRKRRGFQTGKRLFRDGDSSMIGGVSAGIAAYLGISDPLWVRLAFIIFTISGGFGIALYLVLWAVVPKAQTAGDRLAMRGEPINVSNIGRIIEEELRNFSEKVSELGSELNSKKKSSSSGDNRSNPLAAGISILGQVIRALIDVLAQIWKPVLILIGIVIFILFAITWIGTIIGIIFGESLAGYMVGGSRSIPLLGVLNVLFLITLPLIGILLSIVRGITGNRTSSYWGVALTVFWTVNLFSLFTVGAKIGREFTAQAKVEQEIPLEINAADTLHLVAGPKEIGEEVWFNIDNDLWMTDGGLNISDHIHLKIKRTDGDQFRLLRRTTSRGRTHAAAEASARGIGFEVVQQGDQLTIPSYYFIPSGNQWRAQYIELTLEVPANRALLLDETVSQLLVDAELSNPDVSPWREEGHYWGMTEGGLSCLDCLAEK